MRVTVNAELPIDAATYLMERDGAAFRSFIAEVGRACKGGCACMGSWQGTELAPLPP